MKMRNYSLKLVLLMSLFVFIFIILSFEHHPPLQDTNPESGYYIVVAAYRANQHGYASRLVNKITSADTPAKYAYFKIKKCYIKS
ncbi:MAG: hypothetical protein IH947_07795 [Bacteroidetes bacterium]|nr:hypothetical protein [Bacteroidota bacterium]